MIKYRYHPDMDILEFIPWSGVRECIEKQNQITLVHGDLISNGYRTTELKNASKYINEETLKDTTH